MRWPDVEAVDNFVISRDRQLSRLSMRYEEVFKGFMSMSMSSAEAGQ